MTQWPHDDPASLAKFYGRPGTNEVSSQLVPVVPPFKMYYEGKPIKAITFHRKAASALMAALQSIWEHYGHDQATLDKLGISNYSGSFNPRLIRGSSTRWSNHAYGAAIDINAEKNGFGTGHGTMPQPVIDAFKAQGALWGGDYHGRTDPMHFEFCSRGGQAVGLIDAPMADGDSDASVDPVPANYTPPEDDPDDRAPAKKKWWQKAWSWASGGGVATLGAGLYDYRVAIALGVVALIVFLVVWFTYLRKKLEKDGV